jgi:glycosyltransferase involved in cell wall biosynthesis
LGRLYLKHKQELFRRASLFICISEFIKQRAMEAGFPESKLRVHYIGIDREFFCLTAQPRDPNLVIFVGRLIEQKGCRYLIEAMKIVRQKCADAKLVVIGDGPAREEFTALAEESAISCQFLGAQPPEVIRDWLGRARLFCCPSVTGVNGAREGLGTVFTEAQAMGVPVVSSNIGGIPEAVRHGETGLLAPERDPNCLARHILRYLTDDAFWRASSYRAVEWTKERFDLRQQTQKLENIYEEVIDQAAGRHYRRSTSALSTAAGR